MNVESNSEAIIIDFPRLPRGFLRLFLELCDWRERAVPMVSFAQPLLLCAGLAIKPTI